MRAAIPLLVLLAGCAQVPPAAGGSGIVSTNPCADALLIALVPPERLAAISHYSRDAASSSIAPEIAARFRTTAGTAEEVIALNPDLVVTSSFTPAATRAAYARAGLKTLVLGSPVSIAESTAQVAQVAGAVGAIDKGRALIARIDAAVADAAAPQAGPQPSVLLFITGDLVNGPGNLLDELMTRAGFRNAARDHGLHYSATLSTERLVADPPDLMLSPDPAGRQAARRARVIGPRTRQAEFSRRLINCGGPAIIPAIERLAMLRRGSR